ncbi:MAG: glycine zipper 2TM domain-containing protein [Betaproteobacteria bacterium]|nr:MAG: glycine zipper 2TM domain-containing protein [Betaproteobacteria bacterium]
MIQGTFSQQRSHRLCHTSPHLDERDCNHRKERFVKRVLATLFALTAVGSAFAQSFSDTAQVISAQPIYERVTVPRQECVNETITSDRRVASPGYVDAQYAAPQPSGERTVGAGTVLGAIIGGVVGHQFGNSSRGRDHGTAAGVVLGGIVGNSIENSAPSGAQFAAAPSRVDYIPETRNVQRCQTVYDNREEVRGYNVTYRYQGRDYSARMAYDPGPTMNVRVNLAPEVRGPAPRY